MATRKDSPRNRAFRPTPCALEGRQLLSGVVTGTDIDGDIWTLRLVGPGTLSVFKQADSTGVPSALSSESEIDTISTAGTDPLNSTLIGTVRKAEGSDGKVFFQNLTQVPDRSSRYPAAGLGLYAIDMRDFWLGKTDAAPTTAATEPTILVPDGVNTLRFGGVDTNHNRVAATAATSDTYNVTLGLPGYGGTRVLIDRSISSAEQFTAAGATTPTTVQHGVVFAVSGRLELFQANAIEGNASLPPGQFSAQNSAASGSGGTVVVSATGGLAPFLNSTDVKGAATGQIGNLRVGQNATNLITVIADSTQSGNAKISNFSIGGETQNILLVAPNGSRNIVFGKGMDTVEVRSHVIQQLQANRGALNSTVVADREINKVDIGGDVVNSSILSGYRQDFETLFTQITGATSILGSSSPTAPDVSTDATNGGHLTIHVAGDVTNSIFAASVIPFGGIYGDPNSIVVPKGQIKGKIEGTVQNNAVNPLAPDQAFFAKNVEALSGPVVPPNVPEAPYTKPISPIQLPGITNLSRAVTTHPALTRAQNVSPLLTGKNALVPKPNSNPQGPQPLRNKNATT